MTDTPHQDAAPSAGRSTQPIEYPANHVLAVTDTAEALRAVTVALTAAGFKESEVAVYSGRAAGDRLDASTGRRGLAHFAVRLAERIGVADEEMEFKNAYEKALRDGRYLLVVATPTEARKARVIDLLKEHGAHTIAHFGRFTIEAIVPPARAD